jgi:indolepyruvate ferredoxin oxidoreductase beta subunit
MKELKCDPLDLVITGVGGQGNVLASGVLGRALLTAGYSVTVGETYGLSQRGGPVMSQVRVSREKTLGPLIPEHRATALLGLEPVETLRMTAVYGHPQVVVLTNNRPLLPLAVTGGERDYPADEELRSALEELSGALYWINATDRAMELGNPILANVIMLGALTKLDLLPIGIPELIAALAELFPAEKMGPNEKALAIGAGLI